MNRATPWARRSKPRWPLGSHVGDRAGPAGLKLIAGINEAQQKNDWEIEVPYVMGLIGTRSTDKQIPGIHDIKVKNRERIVRGIDAVKAAGSGARPPRRCGGPRALRGPQGRPGLRAAVAQIHQRREPGHTRDDPEGGGQHRAPRYTHVLVFPGHGGAGLSDAGAVCAELLVHAARRLHAKRWLLRWALFMLPAPWIACELGWFVAEYGRQPWTIYGCYPPISASPV